MNFKRYTVLIIAVLLLTVLCLAVACEKHEHSYVWEETTAPTCEGEGVETGTCLCGNVTTRPISALGHEWGEYVVIEEPTDDSMGTITATCKKDADHKHSTSLPVLSDSAYSATPDEKQFNIEYSININDEVTGNEGQQIVFTVCVHEHSFEWEIVEEATCLTEGTKKGTCSHELCEEVVEESIPKVEHSWTSPTILVVPTGDAEGRAVVTCVHDENGDHTREYVLPSLSTSWNNHAIDGDEKECLYTGYVGSFDPEDDTVMLYEMNVYDPFQGYNCGPQNYTITIEVSTTNHVHVFSEYEITKMPNGNESGTAVAHCLIVPEHTHSVSLPRFNNNFSGKNDYTYEVVGDMVNWSIVLKGYNNIEKTFSGSYEKPTSIAIKTTTYPSGKYSEEYNDGDTIEIKVGDLASMIVIVTPLGGKNAETVSLTCTDINGKEVLIYRDLMTNEANLKQGLLLENRNGYTYYVKDFCPTIHNLTIDAGNGLTSTFIIKPILSEPSSGANVLKPQVYNERQGEWYYVNGTVEAYLGAELIVGTGAGTYIDPSSTIIVFDEKGTDVTADCIVNEVFFKGYNGFVFVSNVQGLYSVQFTSTRNLSHSVSIAIEVQGYPNPSELFDELHYYSYSTSNREYTVAYSEVANDDEAGTSSGKATLTVKWKGSSIYLFTYQYSNGKCEFTTPKDCEYSLSFNNNFELILSYYDDEFENIEISCTFKKLAYFTNSLIGSYSFAYNANFESSEMKLILTCNQSGIYKITVTGNSYVCLNVNHDDIPELYTDSDYWIGIFNRKKQQELTLELHEGDYLMFYNYPQAVSNVTITLEETIVDDIVDE